VSDPPSTTGHRVSQAGLTIGALGVVFGDIGTSPLYAMRETFLGHGGEPGPELTPDNVVGALSLTFWALVIVICLKYLSAVMRADNQGEGGILALTALLRPASRGRREATDTEEPHQERRIAHTPPLILLGLFGASLLYGDGMITPSISVLSAVEGTKVVTPSLSSAVVPIAVLILVALFSVQRRGTAAVGRVFGPVMILWFTALGTLGIWHLTNRPSVLRAVNPFYGAQFFIDNGVKGFLALGSVFLVVTGGEALYADMGHFGRTPILRAWYFIALPGLLLNYFGQGALLLGDPGAIDNPFYRMAPRWGLWPLVILATSATVIASQALISGVFSLTKQAVSLGYLPRVRITHTSETQEGQIYIGVINWGLLVACVALVIGFGSSSNLAAAYGLAVTATMAVTTILFYAVATRRMRWRPAPTLAMCAMFLVIDLAFLGANIPKVPHGGWLPILVGFTFLLVLTTWFAGRRITAERMADRATPIGDWVEALDTSRIVRGPGVGVYLGPDPAVVPKPLENHLRHARVLPETVVAVAVRFENRPHVPSGDRIEHNDFGNGIHQIIIHVGFTDDLDLPAELARAGPELGIDFDNATYVLGRETLRVTDRPGMAKWREYLYVFMIKNATTADAYFRLPPDRTVELGVQVEL
jgi:KUP system potassium uptake protein